MPPRMEPEDAKSVWGGEEEDDEDATLVSTHHLVQPNHARAPSPSPGPFHPSRRPRKEPPTTPRWGALAVMALALLAVEALILLGVTDMRGLWGGGSGGGGSTAAAGSGSCQADNAAATEEGPFAGLRQWVGEQAETGALWARYQAVVDEFEGCLEEREGGGAKARGWTLLSASKDGRLRVSLRWPDAGSPGKGTPMLIAEGLYYNTTAAALFEAMRVRSTHRTMPHLDPFFEDYKVLKSYGPHSELGRRTTKRLLVYGKRDFVQASVEEAGRRRKRRWRGLGLEGKQAGGSTFHHPKEWVSASLSVPEAAQRDAAGPFHALCHERPGYTRAYQDLVGFYTPIPGPQGGLPVAAATLIMRTELRGHIPHWAFAKTAGPTGMHLLHTLQKMTGALDRPPQL